eukprot:UN04128
MDFISYAFVLFTVAAYSQCDISITQSPGTTIPDDDSNGIQHDITVPAQPGCFVDSLSIALEVTHPNVGELQFSLNDFDFFSNQCYGTPDLLVTVTDSSATPYGCPNGADDVQPSSPFAGEFGGDLLDVETIWTLSVIDALDSKGDEGTLESWALCITTYCPTTTAMPISTATAMPISTTATNTTTMAISSDSSSDSSSESAESDDSSDDANNALFAGNEEMD